MPPGAKSKYTDEQKRKAEHIEQSYESRGVREKEAERRAWATVNKDDGGGSGRGKLTGNPAAHKGGPSAPPPRRGDRRRADRNRRGRPPRPGNETRRGRRRGGGGMTDRDKRIQEIAYQLWVQEGRPEGRSASHWLEAVALYEAETARSGSAEAKPAAGPVAEKPARSAEKKTPEPMGGEKTAAPHAQKPASASKPKSVEAAGKPAPPGPDKPSGASKKKPPAK